MKYIIVKVNDAEVPIVFSSLIGHDAAAQGFKAISKTPYSTIIAAGFCRIEADDVEAGDAENMADSTMPGVLNVSCHGWSQSMDVKSRGEVDAEIIKRELNRWKPSWMR